jgi:hypothetical protein
MEFFTKKLYRKIRKLRYGFFLSVFIALTASAFSQDLLFDTKGTDFWLTFMPNYHDSDTPDQLGNDNLYFYITAIEPTNILIKYRDIDGREYTQTQYISNINVVQEFQFHYSRYELRGDYPENTVGQIGKYCQTIQSPTFHITSEKDIAVYALNSANFSSEAFLVYPTDVLNKQYMVMSYNSDENHDGNPTPSQFAIIAAYDNTNVIIVPSSATSRTGLDTIKVTLSEGDAYLVQSKLNSIEKDLDLTGSQIFSDKPISVFGGHQRATLPHDVEIGARSSRDCLVEQMPPMSTWGKNAYVIPFPQPSNVEPYGEDVYRIISSVNNNRVTINGITRTINKNVFYEANLIDTTIEIQAESPILVAQFKKTPRFYGNSTLISDPLMMIIPPKEQFVKECKLININKENSATSNDAFVDQYIFVVSPDTSTNNCFIDGVKIKQNNFIKIRASGYSYSINKVADGTHNFNSTGKCGIYVVGYGPANSYGYVGGMEMKVIADSSSPKIALKNDCFSTYGRITDSVENDYGIDKIEIIQDSLRNVRVALGNCFKGSPSVQFNAELLDKTKDGYYTIVVTDVWGNVTKYSGHIQGATLSFANTNKNKIDYDTTQIGNLNCDFVEIKNYGDFPITIDNYTVTNWNIYSVPPSNLPLVIQPKTSEILEVCFHPSIIYDSLPDTLKIYNSCLDFKIPLNGSSEGFERELNSKCDVIVRIGINQVPTDLIFEEIENKPMISTGKIIFGVPKQSNTKFVVNDMLGNNKITLIDSQFDAGIYEFEFDYSNFESGVYFISLISNNGVLTRKLLVNK